jgi:hypothetical protein
VCEKLEDLKIMKVFAAATVVVVVLKKCLAAKDWLVICFLLFSSSRGKLF